MAGSISLPASPLNVLETCSISLLNISKFISSLGLLRFLPTCWNLAAPIELSREAEDAAIALEKLSSAISDSVNAALIFWAALKIAIEAAAAAIDLFLSSVSFFVTSICFSISRLSSKRLCSDSAVNSFIKPAPTTFSSSWNVFELFATFNR